MGDKTTFADLIAAPVSEKVYLAEIEPGQSIDLWALTGGRTYTYEKSYLNETITLEDGRTENIRKVLSRLTEDGTGLTAQASTGDVESNPGSYWHDTANGKVYVHPTGSDNPESHMMLGYFWMYLATKGIALNGHYYEPYISSKGIPALRHRAKDIFWGSEVITSGDLVLINNNGFFDQIFRKFIWSSKKIILKFGGDSLPYSEYNTIFTGTIQRKIYTREKITFNLKAKSFNLFQALPLNRFTSETYPNIDPAAEGKGIPYYYGVYSVAQAPVVTCVDTAYGADQYQFKIGDQASLSISQVYINYDDGSGWQAIAHANENLTNSTFTITSANFILGSTLVKVAFSGIYNGASAIEGAPEIIEHLLTSILPYTSDDLNAASFTNSKAVSDAVLNVPIEQDTDAITVIEKICSSDIAFFDEDEDGKFRYRSWSPVTTVDLDVLTHLDFIGIPQVEDDTDHLYWKIYVGYSYLCAEKKFVYREESSDEALYKFERFETLSHDTYLRNLGDAAILAQRLIFIMGSPSPMLSGRTKTQLMGKLLGDKIFVTLPRAPFADGYTKRIFEIFALDKSCFPAYIDFDARDLKDFGSNAGMWAGATAPVWGAASTDEKNVSGFWLDPNGFADPTDSETKNVSKWW
ncbi:MAG: hypothetical protein P1P89_13805 [Desulfobacterales bacterium]|nr:hypothetical protein [Desulfobacterales bacterium]